MRCKQDGDQDSDHSVYVCTACDACAWHCKCGRADGEAARKARDEAIRSVTANSNEEWRERYRAAVSSWFADLPVGATFIGEELRHAALARGAGKPHHHNAWGGVAAGFINGVTKAGAAVLVGTGQAKDVKSHARLYPQYRKIK